MESTPESGQIHLRKNRPLRLRPGCTMTIHCTAGRVWITTPGEAADIFLETGQSHAVRGYGLTLIEGETEGWIRLEDKKGLSFWRSLLGGCWKKTISRTDQVASVPGWIA